MKREKAKNILFSENELTEIKKAADKMGLSFAAFVRLASIEKSKVA